MIAVVFHSAKLYLVQNVDMLISGIESMNNNPLQIVDVAEDSYSRKRQTKGIEREGEEKGRQRSGTLKMPFAGIHLNLTSTPLPGPFDWTKFHCSTSISLQHRCQCSHRVAFAWTAFIVTHTQSLQAVCLHLHHVSAEIGYAVDIISLEF
ncbi:unnamed protein product [Ilex paraguariensis]|uniref:Uncharacterized protein n=1 Tax=Ilex paraguariensis TaxID=185542 RepID=A0ABC8RP19_9AQUA